jgi:hypothetical protein
MEIEIMAGRHLSIKKDTGTAVPFEAMTWSVVQ